ncbi:MAG: purine-binding chemotaxis protein CheW [Syntrophaceae bacterium]|jgi:chemotaxis-related protein WspB|nr:purine-binding chemotaxis protein CheW [Syntrophaceae bacterium]HOC59481.1 chemotaxis protein CheW [Smithellaceae bacterium]HQM45506.1 chemotaxis protein CheW [Smithellaceae bacterium]
MLMLQFQAGGDRYGINITKVIEVAPFIRLRRIPHAAQEVAGTFNYRGLLTPVIDLTFLLTGKLSKERMSTRIVLLSHEGDDGRLHVLGMMAESMTEMIRFRPSDLQAPVVSVSGAPYLGDILFDERGSVQMIEIEKLLTRDLLFSLFPPEVISK